MVWQKGEVGDLLSKIASFCLDLFCDLAKSNHAGDDKNWQKNLFLFSKSQLLSGYKAYAVMHVESSARWV